jgi:dephospho-CoA kinase
VTQRVRILLSGGIGSGKSTVGRLLASGGVQVIDADLVGHEVLGPGGGAAEAVGTRWPDVVVKGQVDRSRLAAIVFHDAGELDMLESLTHPVIRARIEQMIGEADVAVEVPLLTDFMGEGWTRVVVDASLETRIQRLLFRGMSLEDIERRMGSQPSPDDWLAWADHVLTNDSTEAALAVQVDDLLARLRAT